MSCSVIDVVSLTQDLIRRRSVTPADDGALDILEGHLKAMGFTTHRLPFQTDGHAKIDNLFARLDGPPGIHKGTNGPHFCYGGHTDVVPAGDESLWKHPPFAAEIENGILYGRGTSDMKGSVCAFVAAVSAYLNKNGAPNGSISLLITGDEEADAIDGTEPVLRWMEANNHIPDLALVGEPSNAHRLGETMRIGRRGSLNGVLTAKGRQGHSAYPERADNAAERIIKLLNALLAQPLDNGSDHFPASKLVVTSVDVGNKASNVIAEKATAKFNIRFNDHWNKVSLTEKLHKLLKDTGEPYELTISCNAESFLTAPGDYTKLVADAVEHVSGRRPKYDTGGGTSDARFFAKYCAVVEYGPINQTIHQTDENITVQDLQDLTRTYVDVLERFFKK